MLRLPWQTPPVTRLTALNQKRWVPLRVRNAVNHDPEHFRDPAIPGLRLVPGQAELAQLRSLPVTFRSGSSPTVRFSATHPQASRASLGLSRG